MILCSLILAFCGLTYELVLAQTLTALLGNSFLQYGLTIGLFMTGMGVGALRSEKTSAPLRELVFLQSTLCLVAPLGFLFLWLVSPFIPARALWMVACTLVFSIGFLTGKELPLLMRMAGVARQFPVLAADYFGMLLACVLFPYLLLPHTGLMGTLLIAAFLNGLSLQLLVSGPQARQRLIFSALPIGLVLLGLFEGPISQWFSRHYTSALL